MKKALLTLCISAPIFTACVSPSTMLINDQGKWMRCASSGAGYIGAPMALANHSRCVEDMERMGYVVLPEVVWGAKPTSWSEAPTKIVSVDQGSPADVAGLKVGDIVRAIDGAPISKPFEMMKMLSTKKPGDQIVASVERDGQTLVLKSTLESRK